MVVATELFGVGTMNIPAANGQAGDLPPAVVTQVAKAADAQVGLLATQETIEAEDNRALDVALPAPKWAHFTASSENDLLVKTGRWLPADPVRLPAGVAVTGLHKLSSGKAGVSPARDLAHVCLEWRGRPTWTPFVFAGTHLIVVKKDASLAFREDARAEEIAGLQDNIAYWHDHGLPVILALDSNARTLPALHPDWVWDLQLGTNGIDKIGHLDAPAANWTLELVDTETYANASDHDFQVANMRAVGKDPETEPLVVTDDGHSTVVLQRIDGTRTIATSMTLTVDQIRHDLGRLS